MGVEYFLKPLIQYLTFAEKIVEAYLAQYRSKCGLGKLRSGVQIILNFDDRTSRIDHRK
jgi:hypothetical protein